MSYKLLIALAPGSSTVSIYDIGGWNPSETVVSPYLKASTVIDAGYMDYSSILHWSLYGDRADRDYKFIRARIAELFLIAGWSNLSTEQKEICCRYFVVPKTNQDEIFGVSDQVANGVLFNKNAVASRAARINSASSEIRNRLQKSEAVEIMNEIFTSELLYDKYINFGNEGTLEGDGEGLFDYVESRVGTSYENAGLVNKNFTPNGYADMSAFSVHLMDILKNGNYST